jgi:hypothetical protein
MKTPKAVQETLGNWTFITPIGNLVLTDSVNNELRIDRVLFVTKNKLARIRKRLGLNKRLSEIKYRSPHTRFFEEAEAFAVVRARGKPSELRSKCLELVRDELSILALSQLGYSKRRSTGYLGMLGEHQAGRIRNVFLNNNDASSLGQYRVTKSPSQLILDDTWKQYQEKVLFFDLLKILRQEIPVTSGWRNDLKRAAILIGLSTNSNDVPTAFLWNMVALEVLLTRQGEKYLDSLPKRVEAFLGWVSPKLKERIPAVYKKRNAMVHNGSRSITVDDLLFTDDLLLNLLMNLVSYPRLFRSKDDIVSFGERVEAEQKLGLKSKVRPTGLRFLSRQYDPEDYQEI